MFSRWLPEQVKPALRVQGHWAWLLAYGLLALLLIASWYTPGFARAAWDQIDLAVFQALNGSMANSRNAQLFWAITNSRYFDVVMGLSILGIYAAYLFEGGGRYFRARLGLGLVMAIFILLWMHEAMKLLLDHGRESPTLVVEGAVRIGQAFDFIPKVKDYSRDSFPGDHFGVLILISLILLHIANWRLGAGLLALSCLFALPRMVGGAHWFTDQLVGGGFCGLLGAAVFLAGLRLVIALRR